MQHHIVDRPWMFLSFFFPQRKAKERDPWFCRTVLCVLLFMCACMLLARQIRNALNDVLELWMCTIMPFVVDQGIGLFDLV